MTTPKKKPLLIRRNPRAAETRPPVSSDGYCALHGTYRIPSRVEELRRQAVAEKSYAKWDQAGELRHRCPQCGGRAVDDKELARRIREHRERQERRSTVDAAEFLKEWNRRAYTKAAAVTPLPGHPRVLADPPAGIWFVSRSAGTEAYPCVCVKGQRCNYRCWCRGRQDLESCPHYCCARLASL